MGADGGHLGVEFALHPLGVYPFDELERTLEAKLIRVTHSRHLTDRFALDDSGELEEEATGLLSGSGEGEASAVIVMSSPYHYTRIDDHYR